MFKFLNNMPIFRRLFIIFALAAIVPVIVILVLGRVFLDAQSERSQAVTISSKAQSIASTEQNNLQSMNALLTGLNDNLFATNSNIVKDPSLGASGQIIANEITSEEIEFQETLPTYDATYEIATSPNMSTINAIIQRDANPSIDGSLTVSQDQQHALDAVINTYWPKYQRELNSVLYQLAHLNPTGDLNAQYETIYATLYQANVDFIPLSNQWKIVVTAATTILQTVTTVGQSQVQPIYFASGSAIIAILLIISLAALVVNLTITQRLGRLAALTRRFTGGGDTSVRADIIGRDEINLVATSMNLMLDNIVNLIREAERQRDELQTQVERLLGEVSGVGEGDLSVQAQVTAGTLGALADSFNFMIEELSNLVIRVKMVAGEVESSTTMTLGRMKQLVTSTDMQISQITQATTEVEQMAHSSRHVAERAQILYNGALGARQSAQAGRQSVQLTVEGIGRIQEYVQNTSNKVQTLGERSRAINNVVDAIASIAHQTNRLSLDAAIQAAMAGESGKGFRAVADDIRRLAEEAKTQANSITHLVKSVREDIGALAVSMKDTERETLAGTNLTQQTGLSLDAIFSVVEQQAQEIATINLAARQQSESSNTVVQIMQSVSNSTLQNTSSTHTVEQSMERLARLAQQLQTSVGAFKLRDTVTAERLPERNSEGSMQNRNGNRYNWAAASGPLAVLAETSQPTGFRRSSTVPVSREGNDAFTPYPSTSQPQRGDNRLRSYPTPQPDPNGNSTR